MKRALLFMLLWFGLVTCLVTQTLLSLHRPEYFSLYDLTLLSPRQVEYTLRSSDIGNSTREPSWRFAADIPDRRAVATHADYNQSGYDRGHLCAAADRSASTSKMLATFSMSNICPQLPSVNRGVWKRTEIACRGYAAALDSVSIVVVPVFLQRDTNFIGKHRLAVPHAYFKAVWSTANDSVLDTWFIFNHQ